MRFFFFQFKGRIDFEFTRDMILTKARERWGGYMRNSFVDYEFMFNITVQDWFFNMTQLGYASTIIFSSEIKLRWVGDPIRTFKPDTTFAATVSIIIDSYVIPSILIYLPG